MACSMPEAHEAHMEINGECPWCGHYDPTTALLSDEEFEARYGQEKEKI